MAEEVEDYVTRRGLVKIAALLHDSGKLYTRTMQDGRGRFLGHEEKGEAISADIAKRLKLSRRSEMILCGLTANHMRVLGLSKLRKATKRARYRFFRDADGYGLELLILSLADAMATPVEGKRLEDLKGLIGNLAEYYFEEFTAVPQRPLITGKDIMRLFGIPEGKKVGKLMEAVREAEALGKVSDTKEAIDYLKKYDF
ncbi:MAG: HD domain-containing protein [Deltaproteobacteria bacterium]|nr:HD domain-containing protein [Deltaproteobacteria bacterium]